MKESIWIKVKAVLHKCHLQIFDGVEKSITLATAVLVIENKSSTRQAPFNRNSDLTIMCKYFMY